MTNTGRPSKTSSQSQSHITELRCLRCGAVYKADEIDYVCPHHANSGSDMGTLDVLYDYDAIGHAVATANIVADPDRSIGRWSPLLPIASVRACRHWPLATHL